MSSLPSWFKNDPRRICVLGIWLHLIGLAAFLYGAMSGRLFQGAVGGFVLLGTAGLLKAKGRQLFSDGRTARRRNRYAPTSSGEPVVVPAQAR